MSWGCWRDRVLVLAAVLAGLGLLRSVLVLRTPAAADLPKGVQANLLRSQDPRIRLVGTEPGWQGRDRSQGASHRYTLVTPGGVPMQLELLVQRSREWADLSPEALEQPRLLRLGSRQQVVLGLRGGQPALITCLVGRALHEGAPVAAVEKYDITQAMLRWRDRLEPPAGWRGRLLRFAAIHAGVRVRVRGECLQVTLVRSGSGGGDGDLLAAWRQLYPRLQGWGEQWEGVGY